jgi:hypothetical protein
MMDAIQRLRTKAQANNQLTSTKELKVRQERSVGLGQRGKANTPQQSWGFDGEPPEAVIKESGTRDGTS